MLAFVTKFFGSLLGGWKKWLAIGLGAALVAGYVVLLHLRLEAADSAKRLAELERDQAVAAAETNAEAVRRVREQAVWAIAALEKDRAAADRRARRYESIRREVANAPQSDDGPIAPVLRRALDRLRREAADPGDPGGAPASAGKPAAVRPGAGAAGRR